MNTLIEIHDNNTAVSGTYKVYYKDRNGEKQCKILSENDTDSLLYLPQKEKFFMGKYRFKISEYEFNKVLLGL